MERSEIDALKADLRHMQARVDELETNAEEPTNRRNMLRGLGAAAVGAAAGGLAFARPAAAIDGGSIVIGNQIQTSVSPTMLVASSPWAYESSQFISAFMVSDDATFSNINSAFACIGAYADANGPGADHTIAFWGSSTTGVGAKLDAPTPLKLTDASNSSAPSLGSGIQGKFQLNNGDLWFCVVGTAFSGESDRWRKITGQGVAGAFHAVTPFRVYDSRAPLPAQGVLLTGANRTISVAASRDNGGNVINANAVPAGARAVMANVTVTSTTGGGFLSINPGGNTSQATSAINWSGTGQTVANGLSLTLNTTRQITVVCGSGGGNTNFIVDINGYFL